MSALPFSQACENNKAPILEVLLRHLGEKPGLLLEIAGGTGQHAEFFARHLPRLQWQSSDVPANVDSLNLRLRHAALPNLPLALSLDVTQPVWPVDAADHVFSANSLHIMPYTAVEEFFSHLKSVLRADGFLFVYGPFKYQGEFTTSSNEAFDGWLKQRDALSGIRDFESVNALAERAGLTLVEDNRMPANNQLLVWRKGSNRAA